MTRTKLANQDEWLAAEYAIGVLSSNEVKTAETRYEQEPTFRAAVDGWRNQMEPLLDEIGEIAPPPATWRAIESEIGGSAAASHGAELSYDSASGSGFWKWLSGLTSAAAVASAALLVFVTGGDVTGTRIAETRTQFAASVDKINTLTDQLNTAEAQVASATGALDAARQEVANVIAQSESSVQQVAALEEQLAKAEQETDAVALRLASVEQNINSSVPLVASLTQDGTPPAFVAQYDPLKRSLLIRTSAVDQDEKVPEVWFIPGTGAKTGEALSLGVMNEAAPERIAIEEEFIPWMGEGGTLAITMEQAGGSPSGAPTGAIIAVGKLLALQ